MKISTATIFLAAMCSDYMAAAASAGEADTHSRRYSTMPSPFERPRFHASFSQQNGTIECRLRLAQAEHYLFARKMTSLARRRYASDASHTAPVFARPS